MVVAGAITAAGFSTLSAQTASINGTELPPATQVVDSSGAVWTIASDLRILRNGRQAATGWGTRILWTQQTIYVFGTDSQWWRWTGSGWVASGSSRPGGAGSSATSADGTELPPASSIVDASGAVWSVGSNFQILRNRTHAASGYGSRILWYQHTVYVFGTDSQWWRWTGSGWVAYGTSKPGVAAAPATSADGTELPPASRIVDQAGSVWTVAADRRILRNGAHASGGYGTRIYWYRQTVYVFGTDSAWWQWTGSSWRNLGTTKPGGSGAGTVTGDVSVSPGDRIQDAVDSAPEGAVIVVRTGVHRITASIRPKSQQTLAGEPGAIISGARRLTDFSRVGNYWVAYNQAQNGTVIGSAADEVCQQNSPRCGYPEDLFFDNTPLRHVATLAEVSPGRWFFDYATDRIYVADDPTGRMVETSIAPFAFEGGAAGVRLRRLTIEKFATPTHQGAINGTGNGWVIEDSEIRWNHFAGIRTGDRAVARRNHVHHNGAFGFIGSGQGITVENNEISYNNTLGYNAYWGAGGSKWVYTDGLVVRGNYSHHNFGNGLWTDINNVNVLFENNRVEDNDLVGIFHEVSYSAVIRNNSISRNGVRRPFPGWVDGAGILVSGSSDVEVYGNSLVDNWQGITGLEGHRGAGNAGPWELRNLHVHDNVITQTGTPTAGSGRSGVIDTAGTRAFNANNRWVGNRYQLPSTQLLNFMWMGQDVTTAGWQNYGQDPGGTFSR